jgi:hypothetical protein
MKRLLVTIASLVLLSTTALAITSSDHQMSPIHGDVDVDTGAAADESEESVNVKTMMHPGFHFSSSISSSLPLPSLPSRQSSSSMFGSSSVDVVSPLIRHHPDRDSSLVGGVRRWAGRRYNAAIRQLFDYCNGQWRCSANEAANFTAAQRWDYHDAHHTLTYIRDQHDDNDVFVGDTNTKRHPSELNHLGLNGHTISTLDHISTSSNIVPTSSSWSRKTDFESMATVPPNAVDPPTFPNVSVSEYTDSLSFERTCHHLFSQSVNQSVSALFVIKPICSLL